MSLMSLTSPILKEYDEVQALFVKALKMIRTACNAGLISPDEASACHTWLNEEFGHAPNTGLQRDICESVISLCESR